MAISIGDKTGMTATTAPSSHAAAGNLQIPMLSKYLPHTARTGRTKALFPASLQDLNRFQTLVGSLKHLSKIGE
jgi:hypothetical protein